MLKCLVSKTNKKCLANYLYCGKAIFVILLWQFSTGLLYNFYIRLSSLVRYLYIYDVMVITSPFVIMSFFSPLAGYFADTKYSRFKVLRCSTLLMILSSFSLLLVFTVLDYTFETNKYNRVLIVVMVAVSLVYYSGHVFFIANIIQFGTDQLRDAPTRWSVVFLHLYYLCDNFGTILTSAIYLPNHEIYFHGTNFSFDNEGMISLEANAALTSLSSLLVLCVLHKKQNWLSTENIRSNPYKLVSDVIVFAIRHKRPIRRSAFTFSEDERPCRIDHGKQKYGGPYTTEQVEDVKTLTNILKVLFCLGPVFILDLSATVSSTRRPNQTTLSTENPLMVLFIDYGLVSPVFGIISIFSYLLVLKPFFAKVLPNIFRRMGLSIALLIAYFLAVIMLDALAYDQGNSYTRFQNCRWNSNSSYQNKFISIPSMYILLSQHILLSITHMLLYIGVWEFICCQSPQSMKGLLFGLFFAIRAFYQFLALLLLYPFIYEWSSTPANCSLTYLLVNLTIGLVSLSVYSIVARRYTYRKRDDIYNIYQYAEDYYTKYGTSEIQDSFTLQQ